ncbi:nuclease EXOG, mitochondrial-like isoform X2 [Pollicipes pollicipes]|uniref:nuclease EXOG, mitochondrial-like isoform X2 n=1 Tax=Pollicipes pollicipes TaxID=41117 RepID=UPI0018857483|nr:nuclease EXOG, mitochondrial-like isoform X2 [Pollicipes pollicipes]
MLLSQTRRLATRNFLSGLVVGSLGGGLCYWALTPSLHTEQSKPSEQSERELGNGPAAAPDSNQRWSKILQYGEPRAARPVARFTNHMVGYDAGRKVPTWVIEHIDRNTIKGEANRRRSRFQPDPETAALFSAMDADFKRSGWSRGHMAPAGNNKYDQRAMDETFYYTNIVPQDFDNNSGFWNRLEIYCRNLTKTFDDVNVISGPLFLPQKEEDGRKYVKYEVIGEGEVAVPTHLYKIVVATRPDDRPHVGVFVVPNAPVPSHRELAEFAAPLHEVERRVGVTFLASLDRAGAFDLCQTHGCRLLPHDQVERPYIERRLAAAKTQEQLDRAWADFKRRRVSYTVGSLELYERRQAELAAGRQEL